MPLASHDPDYARGVRAPGPIPGRGAFINIKECRKLVLGLEKKLGAILIDSREKDRVLGHLDDVGLILEGVILRYDRNGPPDCDSELFRVEATLRFVLEHPVEFKGVDVDGLKKLATVLRKKTG